MAPPLNQRLRSTQDHETPAPRLCRTKGSRIPFLWSTLDWLLCSSFYVVPSNHLLGLSQGSASHPREGGCLPAPPLPLRLSILLKQEDVKNNWRQPDRALKQGHLHPQVQNIFFMMKHSVSIFTWAVGWRWTKDVYLWLWIISDMAVYERSQALLAELLFLP